MAAGALWDRSAERALVVGRLETLTADIVPHLHVPPAEAAADPLGQDRPSFAVIVGDLRLLELQSQITMADLCAALDGQPHQLGVEAAVRILAGMGVDRWQHLVTLGQVTPFISARVETVTGTPTLSRRLRDTVARLRQVEEAAGQTRARIEGLVAGE